MSALLATANPHHIKAAHRRRRRCATGHRVYANNNPYKFTDPDGRYVCKGSASDCGAVADAVQQISKAAANPDNSAAQSERLNKVVSFYGAEGQDNGVNVTIKSGESGLTGGGASTHKGVTTISVEMRTLRSTTSASTLGPRLSGVMAHEGDHGIRQSDGGMPTTKDAAKALEVSAYGTEALLYRGLNFVPAPHNLWSPARGISDEAIDKAADMSTRTWCARTQAQGC